MTGRPLRSLFSACQCGPGMGSVSQIGWEWYSRLSRLASVALVTHARNRACLQAAASGLPAVAVNCGGPAEIVDEEVGRPVSADGPEQLIAGLVETFRHIARNPEQWRQRGERGRQRAEKEYGWEVPMRSAPALHRRVLGDDKAHA